MYWVLLASLATALDCQDECLVSCLSQGEGYECYGKCCDYDATKAAMEPLYTILSNGEVEVPAPAAQKACDTNCVQNCLQEENSLGTCAHSCDCSPHHSFDFEGLLELPEFAWEQPLPTTSEDLIQAFEVAEIPSFELEFQEEEPQTSCEQRCFKFCEQKSENCLAMCTSEFCREEPVQNTFGILSFMVLGLLFFVIISKFLVYPCIKTGTQNLEVEDYYVRI
mmetsp:Transcript_1807/g.2908  ORF Transcript_1807/g.2908 Transcript_1807/m.2908 type:complete len:223 (-) Transcript_1807:27-695(-)